MQTSKLRFGMFILHSAIVILDVDYLVRTSFSSSVSLDFLPNVVKVGKYLVWLVKELTPLLDFSIQCACQCKK